MPIIFAVGLFCYDEFEETPNEKVVNMSKSTKPYFRFQIKQILLNLKSTLFYPFCNYFKKFKTLL